MKFWHVGLTVENLDAAIAQYKLLGLKVKDKFEKDTPHALAALMLGPNGTGVELWQWLDKNHSQVECIKNHLAFISDNPKEDIRILEKQGCEVVIPETTGMLVTYTFLRDPNGAYIEIAETKNGYGG